MFFRLWNNLFFLWNLLQFQCLTGTGNWCSKMRYTSTARDALPTSAHTKSGRWSAFFRSWWKLLERTGMVSKKDAAFVSWPNYHRKKSQLLCYTRGESRNLTQLFWLCWFFFHSQSMDTFTCVLIHTYYGSNTYTQYVCLVYMKKHVPNFLVCIN